MEKFEGQRLTLRQIAACQFPELVCGPNQMPIRVGLPSLQRGAVWNAGQVELLWDSILRGFPIGSIVVCEKLVDQATRSGRYGKGWGTEQITHHLLDGQQRCNAIALGFLDAVEPAGDEKPPATLWIDLDPAFPPSGSTREFLLRMLTESHPWGYKKSDREERLTVSDIRDAVRNYGSGKRPEITKAWPHASRAPIPFAWLATAALIENLPKEKMWKNILEKLNGWRENAAWARVAAVCVEEHLDGKETGTHLNRIDHGLANARDFAIVYLEVPSNALEEPGRREQQESKKPANSEDRKEDRKEDRIHNVEQLFQRLNNAGTELRGEELMFSMIKAYWPNVEGSFDLIRKGDNKYLPMPGSRLAALSARAALIGRAALIDKEKAELPPALNVGAIRKLRFSPDEEAQDQKAQILCYWGIDSDGVHDSHLHRNLQQVDKWLLPNGEAKDVGLPPALRSSLAQDAPEVFLLLLYLAQRVRDDKEDENSTTALREPILGLATALHWFGVDKAKKAVGRLYKKLRSADRLSPETFHGILRAPSESGEVLQILTPDELCHELPHLRPDALQNESAWRTYQRVVKKNPPQPAEKNKWEFIERVRYCRPLLLFAQCAYLNSEFPDYDPSCVNIWQGHNRPWDYDHILPVAVLNGNRKNLREHCREWVNTIGNLRAWPLEKNRAKGDKLACEGIKGDDLKNSLISDENECRKFSLGWDDVENEAKVVGFMNAAQGRMLRIYKDWFDTLEISKLLAAWPVPAKIHPVEAQ